MKKHTFEIIVVGDKSPDVYAKAISTALKKENASIIHKNTDGLGIEVYYDLSVTRIQIVFDERPSKDRAEEIVNYAATIPFFGKIWGEAHWFNYKTLTVFMDFNQSKSSNYKKHEPLEKLALWLTMGTPIRQNFSQAIAPAGKVKSIHGY